MAGMEAKFSIRIGADGLVVLTGRLPLLSTVCMWLHEALVMTVLFMRSAFRRISIAVMVL